MADQINATNQTNKMCPVAGMTISGSTVSGCFCLRGQCQLWIPSDYNSESDKFAKTTGVKDKDGGNVNPDGGRCGLQGSDFLEGIYRIDYHNHRHHMHGYGHLYNNIPTQNGGFFWGLGFSLAQNLSMEYVTGEDVDGNNKIYGSDYYVKDSAAPPMIQSLNASLERKPYHWITWESAKKGIFPPMLNSVTPSIGDVTGGTRIKITGGFFSGNINQIVVKIGDNSCTNVNVADSKTLYCTTPPGDSTGDYSISITNYGNTFDSSGFNSLFLNTGGTSTFSGEFTYTDLPDDSSSQQELIRNEPIYTLISGSSILDCTGLTDV